MAPRIDAHELEVASGTRILCRRLHLDRSAARTAWPCARPRRGWKRPSGSLRAIDLNVVGSGLVMLVRDPARRPFSARARSRRLPACVEAEEITLVVMDCALSPVQQRNLEKAWGAKVIDRTGLILEIFGRRARTKEGTLAGRARPSQLSEGPARPLLDPSGAPARRRRLSRRPRRDADRVRPAAAAGPHRQARARTRAGQANPHAASRQPPQGAVSRSWRWSATPMPASRRCSTA